MSILKQADKLFQSLGQDMCDEISLYMAKAYVHKTPHSLLIAKPVRTDKGDPNDQWDVVGPDAWFVKAAVGENCITEFINRIPYPLPYVGWMRDLKNKPVKWYKFDQILRRREK